MSTDNSPAAIASQLSMLEPVYRQVLAKPRGARTADDHEVATRWAFLKHRLNAIGWARLHSLGFGHSVDRRRRHDHGR